MWASFHAPPEMSVIRSLTGVDRTWAEGGVKAGFDLSATLALAREQPDMLSYAGQNFRL